jgi:hypothetical protein
MASENIYFLLFLFKVTEVVRFESKWIASLSLFFKLSLVIGCTYLMCQRSAYQVFDRSPISAVTIKVKPSANCSRNSPIMPYFPDYNCTQSRYDVNDFILPVTENSAVSITTRMTETEHVLTFCNDTRNGNPSIYNCYEAARCILPPLYRDKYGNQTTVDNPQLCWFKLFTTTTKQNYQALDYILFVKNFVEFPQLHLVRDNLASDIVNKTYLDQCEYHPIKHPLCPKFRILKILQMIETNSSEYESMFLYGSLIEIKISWKCNIDRRLGSCVPNYGFQRLDVKPYRDNPFDPGSKFLTSRHFFRPNGRQLRHVHTNIYNLHIIVSVTGEVGKFDLFQTTTSIGSLLLILYGGTVVWNLITAFFTNFKRVKYES